MDHLKKSGWNAVSRIEEAEVALIECYDNGSATSIHRLNGTIGLTRQAIDEIERSPVKRVALITDQSSTSGAMRKGTREGLAFADVHAMGSATAEILSRMGVRIGAKVKVFRINLEAMSEAITEIESYLSDDDVQVNYEVVTLQA